MATLKFRRGLAASIPTLLEGEPGWCDDNYKLYVGDGSTNRLIGGPTVLLKDENSTINGNVTIGSGKFLTLDANPTAALHAVTKQYADALASGLDIKASCRAATDENITLSGEQDIDGVSVVADDRVLVHFQTEASENGIYVAKSGAWVRASDFDSDAEVTSGAFTFIEEGTVYGDCGYVLTTNDPITVGTTALVFTQFSGAGVIGAGAGLSYTGTVLNVGAGDGIDVLTDTIAVKLDGATLGKSGSGLKIANNGVGVAQIATAIAGTGLTGGGGSPLSLANAGVQIAHLSTAIAGDGLLGGAGVALSVNEGDGLEIVTDVLKVKLDGTSLARGALGVKVNIVDGGVFA